MKTNRWLGIPASALAAIALLACSPQDREANRAPGTSSADASGRPATQASNAASAVSDAGLTAKVKTALLADEQVKGMKINVDTSNQVVTLTGEAQSAGAKQRAEQLAQQVNGVRSVQNNITVVGSNAAGTVKGNG